MLWPSARGGRARGGSATCAPTGLKSRGRTRAARALAAAGGGGRGVFYGCIPRAQNMPVSYLLHALHGKQMNLSGDPIIEIERFIIIPMFNILHYCHYLKGLILIIK